MRRVSRVGLWPAQQELCFACGMQVAKLPVRMLCWQQSWRAGLGGAGLGTLSPFGSCSKRGGLGLYGTGRCCSRSLCSSGVRGWQKGCLSVGDPK